MTSLRRLAAVALMTTLILTLADGSLVGPVDATGPWPSILSLGLVDGMANLAALLGRAPVEAPPLPPEGSWVSWFRAARELRTQGRLGDAHIAVTEALRSLDDATGLDDVRLTSTLNEATELARQLGRYKEALACQMRLLDLAERQGDALATAQALDAVASIRLQQGLYDATSVGNLLDRAEALLRGTVGGEHPELGTLLHNRAMVAHYRHDTAAAEALYKRALYVRIQTLGADSEPTAETFGDLGLLYAETGETAQGISFVEKAIDTNARLLGPDHPWTAWYQMQLGHVLLRGGDADAAVDCLRKAWNGRRHSLGKDHPQTRDARRWLKLAKALKKARAGR